MLEPWIARSASLPVICAGVWGRRVLPATLPALFSTTLSPALSAYLRKCGATGSATGQTACPVRPTLCQSRPAKATRVLSTPWLPVSAPPTGLDDCLFFISLVLDFLAV